MFSLGNSLGRGRDSPSSKPVLYSQERQFDKSKAELGDDYDTGKPDYKNHKSAKGKCVNWPEKIKIDAKNRKMGEIRAVGNPPEENERLKIQK